MSLHNQAHQLLQGWLLSCTRANKLSRNTVAVGIVVLDHLRHKSPVSPSDVLSAGGEIVGARSKLHQVLRIYGVNQPEKYLKEVTTRQAHPDGKRLFELFQYGAFFGELSDEQRNELLLELIEILVAEIQKWFDRQHIKLAFDRQDSPAEWVRVILEYAKSRSGGVVEQHLIGAKLQTRHSQTEIPNFPGHAADVQTGRAGDFILGNVVYHITAAPSANVVQKCGENIKSGLHPVLLVPSEMVSKTKSFAEFAGFDKRLTVVAIEDFIALNVIELAADSHVTFLEILNQIIQVYNERLEEVETDMSLKIEIL